MPISYVAKRLFRSWQLYIALLLGVILASTFFAGINVGADTATKQAVEQALNSVPVDFYIRGSTILSSQNVTTLVESAAQVEEVIHTEAISRAYTRIRFPNETEYRNGRLVGISPNSQVLQGWTDHPASIDENKTYVSSDSPAAKLLKPGDIIQVNMTTQMYYDPIYPGYPGYPGYPTINETNILLNLTVAGLAELDSEASNLARGNYFMYGFGYYIGAAQIVYPTPSYTDDLFLVDWQQTLAKLLDLCYANNRYKFDSDVLINIDRNAQIAIWDIPGSLSRIEAIRRNIENQISMTGLGMAGFLYVQSDLQTVLSLSQMMLAVMRLDFIRLSLPVFFVAWYMGTTVSDVSFNLRRREIGLLLTKGFSRSQLFRMFLTEALFIGIVAGIAGILLSSALVPVFVGAVGGQFTAISQIGIDTMIMTVAFSLVLVVLAVFRPARRASNLPTVQALREYTLVEDVKPYRKRWPWIAFILGTYKLIILALGINLLNEIGRLAQAGGNFLLIILGGIWALFDFYILTYLAPVLFFWGFTKIFIRGSLKFQEITAKAAKFLGDLGVLATRNVQRNPARAASVAFLVALIIGYGIQITGTLASDQDYNTRLIYASVGSDARIDLQPPANVTSTNDLMKNIRSNVTGVGSLTVEYSFYGTSSFRDITLAAINVTDWRNTAYYEESWFTGNDVSKAFEQLSSDNHTIILDRDIAERNNLRLGQKIRVNFGTDRFGGTGPAEDLTIVGFYGIKVPDTIGFGTTVTYTSLSYVSDKLFHELFQQVTNASSTRILVRLTSGTDGMAAATQIRGLLPPAASLLSVSEQLEFQQSDPRYMGTLNVQRLGVAFAILAASVGTALVALISLKERQREASMMAVRGLSFKQLMVMLLTENLAVVTFAVLLGVAAGLIIVYGNVVSFTATTASLVSKRLVFPLDASLTIFAYIGLVFASTVVPVIIMSRRYISRLERVVREV